MRIAPTQFREAMARLGAAVNIITTNGPEGRYGITVSAVCAITDTPGTVLVCINRESRAHSMLRDNGVLCVNVVGPDHAELSARFARSGLDMDARFGRDVAWVSTPSGCPALEDATVSLDCQIARIEEMGTHAMYLCEVTDVRLGDRAEGLMYFDRRFHEIRSAPTAVGSE